MAPPNQSDLWTWSLERYARDGVESGALKLQDEFGLNVNLLLWACWCAGRYQPLPDLIIRKAIDLTSGWSREVTAPLRTARRFLKTPPPQVDIEMSESLRTRIKAVEINAEQVEQSILQNLVTANLEPATQTSPQATARRNLAAYSALSGAPRKAGFSVYLLESLIDHILPAQDDPDTGNRPTP